MIGKKLLLVKCDLDEKEKPINSEEKLKLNTE